MFDKDTYEKEITICQEQCAKNGGHCNWGQCEMCGVVPLLYKLGTGKIIEDAREILKLKEVLINQQETTGTVKPIVYESYLAMIQNSLGSNIFRKYYAIIHNEKTDVLQDGKLSCAYFVSGILVIFGLIKKAHRIVDNTVKDLIENGWIETSEPRPGAVLVWERQNFGDEEHKHIGFYIGNNLAISNSYKERVPIEHDWQFDKKRKVEKILWSSRLNQP